MRSGQVSRVALAVLCAGSVAQAQGAYGTIRGSVTDSAGRPLPGIRVTLSGTSFAAIADAGGRYRIDHVPSGLYVLHVQLTDVSGYDLPVPVPAGGTVWPGDTLTSHTTFSGADLERLPIDDPRQAFVLAPGVVLRGTDIGIGSADDLSIRGAAPGEASVYIDGAPVRFETLGRQQIALGVNAIGQMSLTTGVPDILAADVGGGVISIATRSGGTRLAGSLRADTDQPLGSGSSVGFNRFEGALGGPMPGARRLSWYLSGALLGQSSQYRGFGAGDQPSFVLGGPDTTVQWVDGGGQTQSTTVPQFVQSSGRCSATSNYGFDCRGLRRPLDWSTLRMGHLKLDYSYGDGSSVALTGLASDRQQRFYPGQDIGDPGIYQGARAASRLVVLNWRHALPVFHGGTLGLTANFSLGTDRVLAGPLDPASEVTTRDPSLGLEFSTLHFTGQDSLPFPLTDQIIRNIRSNTGLRVPFLDQTQLSIRQPYRLNPFGMLMGWPTDGIGSRILMTWERRLNGRLALEWGRGHHAVMLGTDITRTSASNYESALLSQFNMDAFLVHPHRFGLFAGDRLELPHVVIDAGVRLDHFAPGGEFSNAPGRIFTDPGWSAITGTSDTAYANSIARVFTPTRTQNIWSPRLRVVYAVAPRTAVRLAYGRRVRTPPIGLFFRGSNTDLAFASTLNQVFGRDVTYAVSTLLELGFHHTLVSTVALDVVGYSLGSPVPYASHIVSFPDPAVPGNNLNLIAVTSVDSGLQSGVDARVDWSPSPVISAALTYSFAHLPRGSTNFGSMFLNEATSTNAITGIARLRPGGALAGLDVSLLVRATSGLPYTLQRNAGFGLTFPGFNPLINPIGDTKLPWQKTVDLRITKSLRTGPLDASLYADVRNLLGQTNIRGTFTETGATSNPLYQTVLLSPELANLRIEAETNGRLLGDGSIDLRPSCSSWTNGAAGAAGPVNCVALQRVEQRFGNGDGLYTLTEQTSAFNAYYDSFFGPWRFHGPGRTARIGIQLHF
jgi:hypothetical protein